jgi:hypothetical protein
MHAMFGAADILAKDTRVIRTPCSLLRSLGKVGNGSPFTSNSFSRSTIAWRSEFSRRTRHQALVTQIGLDQAITMRFRTRPAWRRRM